MQSTSWETLGWKKHKLESRLPGEISITSDMQMTPLLWQSMKLYCPSLVSFGPLCFTSQSISILFGLNAPCTSNALLGNSSADPSAHGIWLWGGRGCPPRVLLPQWFFQLSPAVATTPFSLLLSIHELSVQFSRSVVSNSLWPHESQHARPFCPSPTPGVHSNSCPSSRWCHPTISSSVTLLI